MRVVIFGWIRSRSTKHERQDLEDIAYLTHRRKLDTVQVELDRIELGPHLSRDLRTLHRTDMDDMSSLSIVNHAHCPRLYYFIINGLPMMLTDSTDGRQHGE